VRPDKLAQVARWMNRMAGRWEERLEAIKQLAENADE
jgi:hypothetical protein